MDNATISHKVLLSVLVLIGAAFVFQGIGDTSPTAHTLILFLLVGVVLILGMTASGWVSGIAQYPWLPAPPPRTG